MKAKGKKTDLSKFKRVTPDRVDSNATKIAISLRLEASDISMIKDEADRLGIPYQTLIGSVIHRFVAGELIDKKDIDFLMHG